MTQTKVDNRADHIAIANDDPHDDHLYRSQGISQLIRVSLWRVINLVLEPTIPNRYKFQLGGSWVLMIAI